MKNKLISFLLLLCLFSFPLSLTGFAVGEAEETDLAPSYLDTAGGAYVYIRDALLAGEEKIELRQFGLSEEELAELFATLYYSEAQLFFVDARYSFARDPYSDTIVSFSPFYTCERSEIAPLLTEFYGMIDEILDGVPSGLSDFGKAAWVHDYIASSFVYDNTYTNYDAYSILKTGTGVCQPYSLLARCLLRSLGIAAECVTSDELSHEWNTVCLDGEWYHMDITWDDEDDEGFLGQISHEYFLCSDAEFMRGEHASEWVAHTACDDTRYDGDFAEVTSAFVFAEDEMYAIESGAISRYTEEEGFAALFEINEIWHTYRSSVGWQGTFSGLFYAAGRLIFNTETELWYYEPKSGRGGRLAALQTVGGYVYGIRLEGDNVCYALKREPNEQSFSEHRSRLVFYVDWVIGEKSYRESYLYGDTPVCKQSTALPEDDLRLTFLGWDRKPALVTADAVYTALYESVELYPASAAKLIQLVSAAGDGLRTLAERFDLLSDALAIRDRVNPSYEGVAEAKAELTSLIEEYNADAAAFCFAGWVPKP